MERSGKLKPILFFWSWGFYRNDDRCVKQHEKTHETYGTHDGKELDASNPVFPSLRWGIVRQLLLVGLGGFLFRVV